MSDEKVRLAPKPAKKVAEKKAVKRASAGPTKADFKRLQEQLEKAQARTDELRAQRADSEAQVKQLRDENILLRSGIDPHWTDEAILFAFNQAKLEDGALGAVMAVLQREIEQIRVDAEAEETTGNRANVPSLVGAAARLGKVRDHIIALHEKANLPMDDARPGRVSRYKG